MLRKLAFFGMICIVLVSLFLGLGYSQEKGNLTGIEPTPINDTKINDTGKVNISSSSVKDIVSAVHKADQLVIHGTEYKAGEKASIFLQLKDQNNNPILNGTCYLDLFHPNKTKLLDRAPMLYLANSKGIYFYEYNIPSYTGVYMMSAECTYSQFIRHYYTLTAGGWNPFEATSCGANQINITVNAGGSALGTPIVLNNLMDWAYVYQAYAISGGTKQVNTTFTFNATQAGCKINKSNTQSLSFYYMGETYNSITMQFYAWNWVNGTKWDYLGSVATAGLATASVTSGVEDYFSGRLDVNNHTNSDGTVKIMVYASSGSGFSVWYDWFGLVASTNTTDMVDLKGSGELHVSPTSQPMSICSIITNKKQFLPNENMRFYLYTNTNYSQYSIFHQNGTSLYDSPMLNASGVFGFNYQTPSEQASYYIEMKCGSDLAYETFIVSSGFWDIPFEPLILFAVGIIALLIALLFFSSRRHD